MSEIMVVYDDNFLAQSVYEALQMAGYRVDKEWNPRTAAETIVNGSYGLVVSGTEIPGMSGFQMMDAVRRAGCGVPFLGTCDKRRHKKGWTSRGAKFLEKNDSVNPYLEVVKRILGY